MKTSSLTNRLKSLGQSLLLGSALLLSLGQQATAQAFTNNIVDYGDGTSIPFGVMRTHTDGSVYALWRDGGNSPTTGVASEYKLIKWNEAGGAWGAPIGSIVFNNIPGLLAASTPGDLVDLAIDSSGGFHVVLGMSFSSPTAGNGVVYAYSATGASWSYSPVAIYTGDNNGPAYPTIELDGSNNPNVFLLQRNVTSVTPPPFTDRNYTAWHYTRSGGTWSGQQIYNINGGSGTSGNEINELATTLDSNGKAHMLISAEVTGDNKKNITYATNASGSWVTQVIVPTLAITQTTDMDLVIDSNNKLHAIYSPITDRIVHYLTNRSGSWVDTPINGGALSGRLGAFNSRALSITGGNDLFFVYNSSPTSANAGNLSYGYLPAATGNSWQTGSVMNGNFRTGDRIATAITDTGRALALFEHFTDPGGTGSPSNSTNPPNSRQLQYATAQFTPTLPNPNLTINDVTLSEGNTGTTSFTFTVSLSSAAPAGGVTFDIATANGTATTAGSDYTTKSLTGQTISAGNSTYSFTVLGIGDTAIETNETFFVNVTNVTNATVTDGQGVGTIVNDDADNTPPDTTLTVFPPNPTTDNTPSFQFTGTDNIGVTSYEVRFGTTGSFTTATSPYTSGVLADGTHTFQVRAKDAAGNVDTTPASYTFTLDATAPAAPVLVTPANGSFTNNNTPTISGTAEALSTVTIYLNGSSYQTTSADAAGNWTYTVYSGNALAGAGYSLKATARDAAGNTSPDSNTNVFTVDFTPPPAPVLSTPANGSTTNDNTPVYSGAANQAALVTVYVDGSSIGTATVTGGNWSLTQPTALADGSHSVTSTATDAAGNTSTSSSNTNTFTVDATPPVAPVVTAPTNNSRTNDNTPTYTGTAENNVTVNVIVDGSTIGTPTANASGNWTFTPSAPLSDAGHTVRATATDAAGNTGATSSTITFTVDTTPPLAPVVVSPDGDRIGDSTPLITGTAENNTIATIYIDNVFSGIATVNASGNWTYTVLIGLGEEAHTVKAITTDSAGNVSPDSATNTFYVDTTPPPAPVVVVPEDGLRTADNTPVIHGTTEPYSTVYITLAGPTPLTGSTSAGANGVWVYPLTTARADGEYTVKAYAKDGVQNTGPDSATNAFTVDTTAPTVALSTAATAPGPLTGFTVTAQFNEAVTDFSQADLVVANANISDFTFVDQDTYTFFLTPTAPGVTVTVDIAASAGNDLAGNASTAATQLSLAIIDRAVSVAANVSSVMEGNGSDTTTYLFTLSRTGATVGQVNMTYTVTGGGTDPANAADFAGGAFPTGTVSIPDGQASDTFAVTIARDSLVEPLETFTVTLSNPDNGYVVATASALGHIVNDDSATVSVAKRNDGAEYPKVDGKFRVSISAPSAAPTGVAFVLGGTAFSGTDYTAPVGIAVINAGDTFADITIPVITDYVVEGTKSVVIQLTNINDGLTGITVGTSSGASLDIADNAPAAILTNAGTPQSTVVATAFATPLSVRVNDSQGNALSNAAVTFTASATTATGTFASSAVVNTNSSGIATASTLTANQVTGSYTVTAAVGGVATPATFALTNTPAATNNFRVDLQLVATAGTPATFNVMARDAFNNIATGYTGTVHLTSSDAGATLGADATLTNGIGVFSATFITGGNQTVTATDTVSSAITGTSNATAVSPRADVSVTLTDSPDPVQANGNITYTVVLRNNGPSNAEGVAFSLPLPEGVTFVSAAQNSSGGWVDGWGNTITSPAVGSAGTVTISPDGSMGIAEYTYVIVGKVGYVGNGTVLTATATATTTTTDPNSANNSATATTTVAANPEIALHNGDSTITPPITDGQGTVINFGTTTVNNPVTRSFTIANTGNDTLSISAIGVPSGFSLVSPFTPQQIAPTAAFTFAVRYDAGAIATVSGDIVIGNNDTDESPFNIPITATRENVIPVAVAQNPTIEEDAVTPITLTGSDADEQPITFAIVDQPQHGTLTGTAPDVTYTPNENYNGTDVFTFKTNDGTADSAEVEVNLTINPVNDSPEIVGTGIPDQIQIRKDLPRTIELAPYFSDPETVSTGLTYSVEVGPSTVDGPTHPSVGAQVTGSSLLISGYRPDVVDITVTATDSAGLFIRDTFTLTTKRVPEIAGGGVPATLISPTAPTFDLDLASYFTDGDGDLLTYEVTNNTDTGVLTTTVADSIVTITPVTPGVASLTILVTDSDGNTITYTFEVTIDDPVPDATPTVTSPPVLNRQTGLYEISLTATNNNQFNVPGFRFRVTSALPAGTRLHNSTAPPGSSEAYMDVLTTLAPGQSIVVVMEFSSTTRNFTGFNPTIIAEPLPEGTNNVGTGAGINVTRFVRLPDGSILMEFSSVAGHWYRIEYSADMVTWKRSLVPVQAGANFTQWIDRGAPYTDSHPSTQAQRFYRVSEILPD